MRHHAISYCLLRSFQYSRLAAHAADHASRAKFDALAAYWRAEAFAPFAL